jgi:gas vesicle protein
MSDSNDGFKTLFTFLAGAAIGAIAGMLLAPKAGKDLRGDVREFTDHLAEDAKSEYAKMSEKARQAGTQARKFSDDAKAEYEKVSEKAKEIGGQAKKFAEDVKNKFRKGEEPEPTV